MNRAASYPYSDYNCKKTTFFFSSVNPSLDYILERSRKVVKIRSIPQILFSPLIILSENYSTIILLCCAFILIDLTTDLIISRTRLPAILDTKVFGARSHCF